MLYPVPPALKCDGPLGVVLEVLGEGGARGVEGYYRALALGADGVSLLGDWADLADPARPGAVQPFSGLVVSFFYNRRLPSYDWASVVTGGKPWVVAAIARMVALEGLELWERGIAQFESVATVKPALGRLLLPPAETSAEQVAGGEVKFFPVLIRAFQKFIDVFGGWEVFVDSGEQAFTSMDGKSTYTVSEMWARSGFDGFENWNGLSALFANAGITDRAWRVEDPMGGALVLAALGLPASGYFAGPPAVREWLRRRFFEELRKYHRLHALALDCEVPPPKPRPLLTLHRGGL